MEKYISMEAGEIVKKHKRKFYQVRILIRVMTWVTIAMLLFVQRDNILQFFAWIFGRN